jgi:hypothetical protein
MNSDYQEGFISRWSRRKLQDEQATIREDELLETPAAFEPGEDTQQVLEESPESSAPVLTDEDMPPIDSLNSDSDFSMFMSSGVSDALRNRALKKLFSAPSFNIRDGLDEYDEDYTSFEKLGDLVTCDMKHQIEMEARKLEREQDEAVESFEDDPIDDPESDTATHEEHKLADEAPQEAVEPEQITGTTTETEETPDEPKP